MQNFIEQFIIRAVLFIGVLIFYPIFAVLTLVLAVVAVIILSLCFFFTYPYVLSKAILEPEHLTGGSRDE